MIKCINIVFIFLLPILSFGQRINAKDYKGWESQHFDIPVRINYIIIQKNDGSGNFPESDSTQLFFKNVTQHVNRIYHHLKETKDVACYKGNTPFIPSINVTFQFSTVFIQNTNYWNNKGIKRGYFCPQERDWWLNDLDKSINSNPKIKRGINIYLTEDGSLYKKLVEDKTDSLFSAARGACSEYPNHTNWAASSRLHYPNEYSAYWYGQNLNANSRDERQKRRNEKQWGLARGLAHELGHSLGLGHNNEHHGRNQCWHSIMHQAGDAPKDYLQPTEIAKINYNLSHTSLTSFIDSGYYYSSPFIIDSSLTVKNKTRLFQDITVKENAVLTISDTLFIPNDAFLFIEKKGELILKKQGTVLHLDDSQVLIKIEREAIISKNVSDHYSIEKKHKCLFKRDKKSQ